MSEIFDVASGAKPIPKNSDSIKFDWKNQILPAEVKGLEYTGEVQIAYAKTDTKKLKFINCKFDIISIKNEHSDNINSINFINCQINSIRIFQSGTNMGFESTSVQSVILDHCDMPKIKIEGSDIKAISFESKSKIEEVLISNDSNVEKLDNKDAEIKKIEIHSSRVGFIYINNSLNLLDIKEGAVLERFLIDNKDKLKQFLQTLKNKIGSVRGGTVSQKIVELKHQQQIILAAYNQYVEDNRFQEMDICLVRLRKINCILNRINTKNIIRKTGYVIEDIFLGKMFGWGVQIINSLMTSVIIIIAFALIYFETLKSSYESVWNCIQVSVAASVNRFFNANEVAPISILNHFDTAEQIIGVIILTIFTGVIARKIIR